MKWSELPQEYRDLEQWFPKYIINEKEDSIYTRFEWDDTLQGNDFWDKCWQAKNISELPKISNIYKAMSVLKEVKEYFEQKDTVNSMPLWLAVKIDNVINHNKTN